MNHAKRLKPIIKEIIEVLSKNDISIEDGLSICAGVIQCLFSEAKVSEDAVNYYAENSRKYWINCIKKENK